MRILVVGEGSSPIHEVAVADAFRQLGHEVDAVYWNASLASETKLGRFSSRIQNKLIAGPRIGQLNEVIIQAAEHHRPDLIFVYRGTHVRASTLRAIRAGLPDCLLLGYNNDDPFASGHSRMLWRH